MIRAWYVVFAVLTQLLRHVVLPLFFSNVSNVSNVSNERPDTGCGHACPVLPYPLYEPVFLKDISESRDERQDERQFDRADVLVV